MARPTPHLTPPPFTRRSLALAGGVAAPAPLRVSLFGRVRLEDGRGRAPVIVPNRTLPTIAYLLLHRADAIPRKQLAAALWPDDDDAGARTRLRSNLHALARALPPPARGAWLSRDTETVRWNAAAPLWLDVAEFETLVRDPARLEDAIALYAGEVADGLEGEWLAADRERLRRLAITALETLVTRYRERREFTPAFAAARRLLEIDPWREDVVRRLISMRYEAGDRAGAFAEFDAFALRLRAEMGTDPMPETVVLRDRLARGVQADEPGQGALEATPAAQPETGEVLPFVGRRAEFGTLVERWERAARGHGGTVLVGGEAGIGKTRLTSELQRHVEDSGGRVLRGSTSFPEAIPYQSFVEALRGALPLVAAAELPAVWFGALSALLPELRQHRAEAAALVALDSERERQRLFEGIVRALLALAGPRPVLLVLEDLHWANEATLAALLFLARRVALAPVLIVATYRLEETIRDHPLRQLRRELQTQGLADHLAPAPLRFEDVFALVSHVPGLRERAAALSSLHANSGGNPLFLTHLIQSLLDDDVDSLPQPLRLLVAARIERMPERARAVAEIAALVGQHFSIEILHEVTGWDEGEVLACLDELIERRLIREVGSSHRFQYGFTHQLVQLAVAEAVPAEVARRRHRHIARVLEGLHPCPRGEAASELARHHELAGAFDDAARYYLSAAQRADSLAAHDEALAHLTRGLSLACERAQRIALLREREALLSRRGERAGQRADLDELAALAASDANDDLRCEVLYRRVHLADATADRDEQGVMLAELRLQVARAPQWEPALLFAETKYFGRLGHIDATKVAAERAIAACRESGDRARHVELLCILAKVQAHREAPAETERLLVEAAGLADSPASARFVLEERTHLAVINDDDARREELCLELAALSRAIGDRKGEAVALERLGIATLLRDQYAEADKLFARSQTIGEEIDDRHRVACVIVNRAHLDMILGSFAEATAAVEEALPIHEAQHDVYSALSCVNNLSALATLSGDGQRARRLAFEALERATLEGSVIYEAVAFENLAEAELACGERVAAIGAMEASLIRRRAVDSLVGIGHGTAQLAVWYAAEGDLQTARERIEEMLRSEATIRIGSPWPHYCYWAAAQVFRVLGEPHRARTHLARAYAMTMDKAKKCPDARRRTSFLGLPWHVAIVAAHDQDRWPLELR